MPWSLDDCPRSWKNQPKAVRTKAVEIGNALLADGMEEGRAIPIALSQARKAVDSADAPPPDLWVGPDGDDGWHVREEGADDVLEAFDRRDAAVARAVALAKERSVSVTVQGRDGRIQDRQSFRSHLS